MIACGRYVMDINPTKNDKESLLLDALEVRNIAAFAGGVAPFVIPSANPSHPLSYAIASLAQRLLAIRSTPT